MGMKNVEISLTLKNVGSPSKLKSILALLGRRRVIEIQSNENKIENHREIPAMIQ